MTIQQRIDLLENEIKILKSYILKNTPKPWWQQIVGVFENDPDFEQISSLGRSIREQERMDAQS
ncbi:MAG TPA: hypothetical protein VGD14_20125 [bacterium]